MCVIATWLVIVGEDDNTPAGVTGSNAAMRLWAGLFSQLAYEPVDLRMPDGVSWVWVDADSGWMTGRNCERAVQMPFLDGSEPRRSTNCLVEQDENEESFWRKIFGKKKDD